MCERVENPSMNSNRIPMEKFKNNTHGKICQNSALRLKVPESDNLKDLIVFHTPSNIYEMFTGKANVIEFWSIR